MKNVTAISQKRQLPRPSEDFISARFTVGRFKVEIHVMLDAPPGFDGQQNIFWTPHAPQQGDLTAADLRHYQKKPQPTLPALGRYHRKISHGRRYLIYNARRLTLERQPPLATAPMQEDAMADLRLISQISEEEYLRAKARREEEDRRYDDCFDDEALAEGRKEFLKFKRRQKKLDQARQLLQEEAERERKVREQRSSPDTSAERKARQEKRAGRSMSEACEICGEARKLVFDHCHTKGHFRGWICSSCNTALGLARNSETLLRKMADYLERDRANSSPPDIPAGRQP